MVVVHQKKDVFDLKFNIMNNIFEKNFYCVSSRVEKTGQLYGCFKIGPFFKSQSLTFANALRRTLLADKSKYTFNAVQIYGVEHEFSNIMGIRESVIDLLINLEKLVFLISKPLTKPQVAFIHFEGPGILRAYHIHLPQNLKVVMPYQYISTLEVDGKLTLKLFFSPNWEKFQPFFHNLNKKKNLNNLKLQKLFFKKQNKNFILKDKKKISKSFSNNILSNITNPFYNIKIVKFFFNKTKLSFIKNLTFITKFSKDKKNIFLKKEIINNFKNKKFFIFKNKNKKINSSIDYFKNIKIKENFLYLKISKCSIERVNYTLESHKKTVNIKEKKEFENSKFLFLPYKKNIEIENNFEKSLKKKNLKYNFHLNKFLNLHTFNNNFSEDSELKFKKEAILMNRMSKFLDKKSALISQKEEYIIFELWTDGSIHPQTAILKGIKNLLFEILPYSLQILKQQKLDLIQSKTLFLNSIKLLKKKYITKSIFNKKFLHLEIGNFYFDLDTFIFLKEKKINRIIDLLNFIKKTNDKKFIDINANFFKTRADTFTVKKIEKTLYKFQLFINSLNINKNLL